MLSLSTLFIIDFGIIPSQNRCPYRKYMNAHFTGLVKALQ